MEAEQNERSIRSSRTNGVEQLGDGDEDVRQIPSSRMATSEQRHKQQGKIKMDMQLRMIKFALLLLLASYVKAQSGVFDVTKYGATPNGDITQAMINAWKDACTSTTPSKVVVPAAPQDPSQFKPEAQWVKFTHVNFLTLSGSGTFDGQGTMAWSQNNCAKTKNCKKLSMNFGFGFLNNTIVRDITSKDSKNFHVNVLECNNITFTNFNIISPENSPNTDGIHVGRSTQVNITNSKIATGDDCISLGDGSEQVNVFNVTCGPGHGISVGSLGKYQNEEPVKGFTVRNCTLNNTDNGVRIKSWPGTPGTTTVSDMHFEDITVINVKNPIIIDQEYCPWNQCTKEAPSKVKISNVTFKNIVGTSASEEGVILVCSSGVPCENVVLSNVDLTFNGAMATAKIANVKPITEGKVPSF
ncbi:Pectin lyase fold/virulence factor [Sesbania bispinosa]|nr:Pectin lyase fold/virulence factor [Sesbania bispinosa]